MENIINATINSFFFLSWSLNRSSGSNHVYFYALQVRSRRLLVWIEVQLICRLISLQMQWQGQKLCTDMFVLNVQDKHSQMSTFWKQMYPAGRSRPISPAQYFSHEQLGFDIKTTTAIQLLSTSLCHQRSAFIRLRVVVMVFLFHTKLTCDLWEESNAFSERRAPS